MATIISMENLKELEIAILQKSGCSPADAGIVADSLLYADLRGIESHGIANLPVYIKRSQLGLYNMTGEVDKLPQEGAALYVIDGKNSMGQVAAFKAVEVLSEAVKKHGIAATFIRHTNHCGALGYYGSLLAAKGCLFLGMTNAPASMAPWGGKQKFVGTNPLCLTLPHRQTAITLDMATSTVAKGKIYLEQAKGNRIPDNWAFDEAGRVTNDPAEALKGTLYPLGGYKGFGLALFIDLISGLLTRSSWGPAVGSLHHKLDGGQDVGIVFIAVDIHQLMSPALYDSVIAEYIAQMKAVPAVSEEMQIMYPGEPESKQVAERLEKGISVNDKTYEEIKTLADQLQIKISI